ncbi:MAG: cell envelope integrity protein CreD [Gammaproteobacteria bacterium]|nr:cell envelope integrity protein CreD [Gammaproteobacteria bacterium]MBQ0774484.1 cell envelope integrity protein CreD [Gammaproteobacteria bacterium]
MWRNSLLAKTGMVLGIFMLLSIPISMIKGQIFQRSSLKSQVADEIAESYSRSQTITGPFIYIPYQERHWSRVWNKELKKYEQKASRTDRRLILTPDQLSIDSTVDTQMRYRGIYGAPVFTSQNHFDGAIVIPKSLPIQGNDIIVGQAYMVVAISDMRGIGEVPAIQTGERNEQMKLGGDLPGLDEHSMYLPLGNARDLLGKNIPFTFTLSIKGSQRLGFIPAAGDFSLRMQSAWGHPRFNGLMLPSTHDINDQGFSAVWQTNHLASAAAINCIEKNISCLDSSKAMNVDFIEPITGYSSVERTVKYSHLFVLIIFSAFLLFEVLKKLRIHALQYTLVGLAQAMFFLLVLALSEHLQFSVAYAIAAVSCIALIGTYLRHVLQSAYASLLFSAALALVYGFLYMTLLSEDHAFLMGSLLLFVVLSTIMLTTRHIDWYAYSERILPNSASVSTQPASTHKEES